MQLFVVACVLFICTPTWSFTFLQRVQMESAILEQQANTLTRQLAEKDCPGTSSAKRELTNRDPDTINKEILEIHVNELERKLIECERALLSTTAPTTEASSTTPVYFPTNGSVTVTTEPSPAGDNASTRMTSKPASTALQNTTQPPTTQPPTTQPPTTLPTATQPLTTQPLTTQPTTTKPTTTTLPTTTLPTTTLPTTTPPTTTPSTTTPSTTTLPTTTLPTTTLPTTTLPTTTPPTTFLPTTSLPTTDRPTTSPPPTTTEQPPTTKSPEMYCTEAITVTDPWRLYYNDSLITSGNIGGNSNACDLHRDSKWFRFGGAAGVKMLESCPLKNSCGAVSPMWTDDSMPKAALYPQLIDAYISISDDEVSNCYYKTVDMEVIRCSWNTPDDFIYRYQGEDVDGCKSAFCGMFP